MKWFERLCARRPNAGLKNLMYFIAGAQVLVFVLSFTDYGAMLPLLMYFDRGLIFSGQVWRLVTFLFMPLGGDIFTVAISVIFYVFVGKMLENAWGTLKFNFFYLTGTLLTIIYCLVLNCSAQSMYINFSMFLAFATLYPENEVRIFFILPIKVKYLAIAQAVLYIVLIFFNHFPQNLLPIVAFLNYLLYFWQPLLRLVRRRSFETKNRIDFKAKSKSIKKRGYLHRCVVCGKTDASHPETEFRYCSLCKSYACYCEEHIMSHTHIE